MEAGGTFTRIALPADFDFGWGGTLNLDAVRGGLEGGRRPPAEHGPPASSRKMFWRAVRCNSTSNADAHAHVESLIAGIMADGVPDAGWDRGAQVSGLG